jgi:hypothetical protein
MHRVAWDTARFHPWANEARAAGKTQHWTWPGMRWLIVRWSKILRY